MEMPPCIYGATAWYNNNDNNDKYPHRWSICLCTEPIKPMRHLPCSHLLLKLLDYQMLLEAYVFQTGDVILK